MSPKPAESSLTSLFAIYAALIILLLATVGANTLPLGPFSLVVALLIAIAKALLVIFFFMHVRFASKTTWIFVACGFLWLSMLFTMTFTDYLTRTWNDQPHTTIPIASPPPGYTPPIPDPPPIDFQPSSHQR
jgi:cytochrome c oxidase subunit 4